MISDNNECESDPKICGSNSVCINNEGSYKCSCQSGFKKTRADGKNCTGKKAVEPFIVLR